MSWTLQQLIDDSMTVHAYCEAQGCHHNQRLDLIKLRDRLGPDAPAMRPDLAPKLRCARCGGKQISLVYAPDTTKHSGMANAVYWKPSKEPGEASG